MKVTTKTDIKEFPLLNRGKVRDIYDIDDSTLLIVTTDRMSAFDVIMNEPVPYKGVILNQITLFWMKKFAHLVKNHLIESDVDKFPAGPPHAANWKRRAQSARRPSLSPPVEWYRGSAHNHRPGQRDYKATGSVQAAARRSVIRPFPACSPCSPCLAAVNFRRATIRIFPRPGHEILVLTLSHPADQIREHRPGLFFRSAPRGLKAAASSH